MSLAQLSPEQCKSVYIVIKRNAISHFTAADLLATSGDHPNAIGHLVLGSEELIKSFFLMLQGSEFPVQTITNYNKLFYTHTARHNVLKELYSVYWFFTQLAEWPKRNKKHNTFQHYLMQFKYIVDTVNNSILNHGWWDRADKIKQNCFYVDHNQDGILSPDDFDQVKYNEANKFAGKLRQDLLEMMTDFENAPQGDIDALRASFDEIDLYQSISEAINRKKDK